MKVSKRKENLEEKKGGKYLIKSSYSPVKSS
jgi:hypothetical protein